MPTTNSETNSHLACTAGERSYAVIFLHANAPVRCAATRDVVDGAPKIGYYYFPNRCSGGVHRGPGEQRSVTSAPTDKGKASPKIVQLTRFLVRDTVDSLAARIPVVRPLVAALPGAHLVMHVDVSHVFVQSTVNGLATRKTVVGMLLAVLSFARLAHRPRLGSRGRACLVESRVAIPRLRRLPFTRVPVPTWWGPRGL